MISVCLVELHLAIAMGEVQTRPPSDGTVLPLLPCPVRPVQVGALADVVGSVAARDVAELPRRCTQTVLDRPRDVLATEEVQLLKPVAAGVGRLTRPLQEESL